jgi:hypothetical protein
MKAFDMSATAHETNPPPIDHDVEIRIKNFRNFTAAALRNFTVLIFFVVTFWVCTRVVPFTISMPFLSRWTCILCLYLGVMVRIALFFRTINKIANRYMPAVEKDKNLRDQDLGTCTTDLEDWMLANFCVIVGLTTIGFVVRYWVEVIELTFSSFFYWICAMGGLLLLFQLLKQTLRYYRGVKGLKHEEAWGILISVNAQGSIINWRNSRLKERSDHFFTLVAFRSSA